jgi:hypothetical protein
METCTIPFACSTVTMISARGGENFIALDEINRGRQRARRSNCTFRIVIALVLVNVECRDCEANDQWSKQAEDDLQNPRVDRTRRAVKARTQQGCQSHILFQCRIVSAPLTDPYV